MPPQYRVLPKPETHRRYFQTGAGFAWQSGGSCSRCHRGPQPTIAPHGTADAARLCRMCCEELITIFEDMAIRHNLSRTGHPSMAPPPITELWICRAGTEDRIGYAQGCRQINATALAIESPYLFRPCTATTADIVTETWKSQWGKRGFGTHTIRRAVPAERLEVHRYTVRMPLPNSPESAVVTEILNNVTETPPVVAPVS